MNCRLIELQDATLREEVLESLFAIGTTLMRYDDLDPKYGMQRRVFEFVGGELLGTQFPHMFTSRLKSLEYAAPPQEVARAYGLLEIIDDGEREAVRQHLMDMFHAMKLHKGVTGIILPGEDERVNTQRRRLLVFLGESLLERDCPKFLVTT